MLMPHTFTTLSSEKKKCIDVFLCVGGGGGGKWSHLADQTFFTNFFVHFSKNLVVAFLREILDPPLNSLDIDCIRLTHDTSRTDVGARYVETNELTLLAALVRYKR